MTGSASKCPFRSDDTRSDSKSETIYRIVDLVVPAGDGPLALPAIRLDSLGWVKMLGKQAAEIEAVDLEGKPVKLADYRGKVVVLAFFAAQSEAANQTVRLLTEVRQRFKDQPLAVLALHDATPTSLANFKKALEPIRARLPARFRFGSCSTGLPGPIGRVCHRPALVSRDRGIRWTFMKGRD